VDEQPIVESDQSDLAETYRQIAPMLTKLCEETGWELKQAVDAAGIKLHTFTSRVKSETAFLDKVERKGYSDPWTQTEDLVGLRAVCLFRSDLRRLEDVVRSCFVITSESDTVEEGDANSFGYMSVHLTAQVRKDRVGPRYDDIKERTFEIQLRTILMDAWANVSHYLDYKGESSIPSTLRRDFYALSGLFYVADKHFELFFDQTQSQRIETVAGLRSRSPDLDIELNLDTLLGFLEARLPDRRHASTKYVSDLVEELVECGYPTVGAVADAYDRAEDAALVYEGKHPPTGAGRYANVGITRIAITIADPRLRSLRAKKNSLGNPRGYQEVEHLVRAPSA
jgi:putative GTP pyrophosphokinase